MRTEEDLRTAFDHLADSAPTADDILAALTPDTKPVRRTRTPLVLGAVLATAAAAIGGPLLISAEQAAQPAPASAWTPWINVPTLKSMRINPRVSTPNRQSWELDKARGPWGASCLVTAHRNGDFDPTTIPVDSPTVDINGAKGRIITSTKDKPLVPQPDSGLMQGFMTYPVKTVAWQPARGLWALVSCETQLEKGTPRIPQLDSPWRVDLPKALQLARAISTGGRLDSPYKIGFLPAGLAPNRVTYQSPIGEVAGSGQNFITVLSDGDASTGYRPRAKDPSYRHSPWDPKPGDDLRITYNTSKFWNSLSKGPTPKPDLNINGMDAWFVGDGIAGDSGSGPTPGKDPKTAVRMEGHGVQVTIQSLGGTVNQADLVKVAHTLRLARSTTDLTTWFDAAEAIPAPR
ncbi:hypothetical protein OHA70_27445 [Kribbella sp. NBC_00382]|uniref:hypothetical protein n=1 Tax=Kribbella sp. NBC_00382 TaxID=2975967 RepID=UPI002E1FA89B